MSDDLSREAHALIDEALTREIAASPARRGRVQQAVLTTVGVTAAGGATLVEAASAAASTAATAGGTAAAAASGGTAVLPWLAGGATLVAAVVVSAMLVSAEPETSGDEAAALVPASTAPVVAPAPIAPAPVQPPEATDEPDPAAEKIRAPRQAAASAATAPRGPRHIDDEIDQLGRVQVALREGRADEALEMLREKGGGEAGVLAEERLASEVFALCQLGKKREARQVARRFLRRSPSSPLAPRVRSSCAFE